MDELVVNMVQIDSGNDQEKNLARLFELFEEGPPCDLIALPEVFSLRGGRAVYKENAEPLPGTVINALSEYAKEHKVWILAGSLVEREKDGLFNSSILIDRSGEMAGVYRKMHLFNANLDDGTSVHESRTFTPGDRPIVVDIDGWICGMSICYDLRFPELFRIYANMGVDAILIPSNFTHRTGEPHWEVLCRARAIENQCYVVAPNLVGRDPFSKVLSHGRSLGIDPWGRILAEGEMEEGVFTFRMEKKVIEETRLLIPALDHRRL